MQTFALALLLLSAVLASSVIEQLVPKISAPLIQIGLGLLLAIIAPSLVKTGLDPELFMVLFIAPLLYDEAKQADKASLWKNRRPVLSLAIGLVIATTLIIGFAVHAFIPSIPLFAAFALGAALGPTDAVAVTSLSKQIDISDRDKSILKGELLINDASGIVSFQFALAATITGTFSFLDASFDFIINFFGGIVVGIILGYLGNLLVRWVRSIGLENTNFHVLFEVLVPFLIFLIGEEVGVSGIISVVVAGLVNVISPRSTGPSIARMNIVSTSVWRVLSFALNGIVFVLLGLQLPLAMQHTWQDVHIENWLLIVYVIGITLILLATRFVWIFTMEKLRERKVENKHKLKEVLSSSAVLTLAGCKGAITLAVLFTIPVYLSPDILFPQRDLIIFLACGTIVCTLLLATYVAPLLGAKSPDEPNKRQLADAECNVEILRNVIEGLTARQTPETKTATRIVIQSYADRIARIKERHDLEEDPNLRLRMQALNWEREFVNDLIAKKEIAPLTGYHYLKRVARIEELLMHSTGKKSPQTLYLKLRSFARTIAHSIVSGMPGISASARTEALRKVQVQAYDYVVSKLRELVPDDDVPAENAGVLLVEYQRVAQALRNNNPSITAIAKVPDQTEDIRRVALQLELEQIQDMYNEERICRATARRLRENVDLMRMDLEDNI